MDQYISIGGHTTPKTKSIEELVSEIEKHFKQGRYEEYLASVDDADKSVLG